MMKRRSGSLEHSEDESWHLVRFKEDGIWLACKNSNLRRSSSSNHKARWPGDGRWYDAIIHASGDKVSMMKAQSKASLEREGGKVISPDAKPCKSTRRCWRKMCNVPLDRISPNVSAGVDEDITVTLQVDKSIEQMLEKEMEGKSMKEHESEASERKEEKTLVNEFDRESMKVYQDTITNKPVDSILDRDISSSIIMSEPLIDQTAQLEMNNVQPLLNKLEKEKESYQILVNSQNSEGDTLSALVPTRTSSGDDGTDELDRIDDNVQELLDDFDKESYQNEVGTQNISSEMSTADKTDELCMTNLQPLVYEIKDGLLVPFQNFANSHPVHSNTDEDIPIITMDSVEFSDMADIQTSSTTVADTDTVTNQQAYTSSNIELPIVVEPSQHIFSIPYALEKPRNENTRGFRESPSKIFQDITNELCDSNIPDTPCSGRNLRKLPSKYYNQFPSEENDPFSSSGSEYRPSSSFSEDSDILGTSITNNISRDTIDMEGIGKKCNTNFDSSKLDNEQADCNPHLCVDDQTVNETILYSPSLSVATINPSQKGKLNRKWDKKFLCTFCKKSFAKVPRHWYKKHSEIPEIAKILSLDIKSKERVILIKELQNKGAFLHNAEAMKSSTGMIVPKRRPRIEASKKVNGYIPCQMCFQLFAKSYLSEHQKKCAFNTNESYLLSNYRKNKSINMLLLPVGPKISQRFRDYILSKMSGDEIFIALRNDPTILAFGESEFGRLGHEARYHRSIIDRLRELGRLIIVAKGINPKIGRFSQLISPDHYQLIKSSTKQLAGFDEYTNTFQIPSLALKLGMSMRKCAIMLKGDYLEDAELRLKIPEIDGFLQVMDAKWSKEIAAHAHRTMNERKWNAPKRLPLASDIQKINKYLIDRRCVVVQKLAISTDSDAYHELSEITMIKTLILNRRRVGEVQFMSIQDYEKGKSTESDSDVFLTLSSSERVLSKSLIRFVIKGKRGRGVPVVLTRDLQADINLLVSKREEYNVQSGNKYLFPSLRNSPGHHFAHTVMKKCAKNAGCVLVETITSTRLRKHVATMTQLLNLRENELDSLAQFMGHDIKIHRQYYRLADETVQLAKISKILMALDKGDLNNIKGKNLDEIEVNDYIQENDIDDAQYEDSDIEDQSTSTNVTYESYDTALDEQPKEQSIAEIEHDINSLTESTVTKIKVVEKRPTIKEKQEPIRRGTTMKRSKTKRGTVIKKQWSNVEIKETHTHFKNYIDMNTLPGKIEIEKFLIARGHILNNRSWTNVKDYLRNYMKKIENE